jgi:pimeloyl-ACP methyl ester carboxylesterase
MALEVIDAVRHKFAIDERRIYVMGQSMGGAGVWNMIASRPKFFAAAVICCGSESTEVGSESIHTPLWARYDLSHKTEGPEKVLPGVSWIISARRMLSAIFEWTTGDDLISSRFSRTAAMSDAAMRSTAFGFLSSLLLDFLRP